jgi:uncharacterized protein with HEPN domain
LLPNKANDLLYLLNILESIGKIDLYHTDAQDAKTFYELNEQLNFNASLNLLANIGESVSKISDDLKIDFPEIDWVKIKAFRNRIVHDYMGIDLFIVYSLIVTDLPMLHKQLIQIIKSRLNQGIFDREEFNCAVGNVLYRHIDFSCI